MTATAQTQSGLWVKIHDIWLRNQDLLRNAGSLAGTTGLTSVFGFVFWIVAAREFTAHAVGYGSAAVNMMQLFGTVGMFGLGTMLIGELPRRKSKGGLVSAALITCTAGSLLLGIIFTVVVVITGGFPQVTGSLFKVLLFTVGTALTGLTLVFDEATIGLMRGGVQLTRNFVMSLGKLLLLPAIAVVLHDVFGVGLILAWVLGMIVSLIPPAYMLKRGGARVFHLPDWGLMRRLAKVAMAHNWLNLAIACPGRIIPAMVTVVVGPDEGGAFYVAWMIAAFLAMVPVHLSTVLFAIASASPELVAEKLRFVLRLSILIGLPAMAVLAIGAHFMLGIFGHDYAALATVPLWLLIAGYIPGLPKAQYIAVCRATNKVNKAAIVLSITAGLEVISVIVGGKLWGLNGLAWLYTGVCFLEGIITAPTVLRAAYARTAAGSGAMPTVPATAGTGPLSRLTGALTRVTGPLPALNHQDTGALAALAALATAAVSEGHTLDLATQIWKTGELPVLSPRQDLRQQLSQTSYDLYGRHSGRYLAQLDPDQVSYHSRQQAGIDALLAIATSVAPESPPPGAGNAEHAGDDEPAEDGQHSRATEQTRFR